VAIHRHRCSLRALVGAQGIVRAVSAVSVEVSFLSARATILALAVGQPVPCARFVVPPIMSSVRARTSRNSPCAFPGLRMLLGRDRREEHAEAIFGSRKRIAFPTHWRLLCSGPLLLALRVMCMPQTMRVSCRQLRTREAGLPRCSSASHRTLRRPRCVLTAWLALRGELHTLSRCRQG
jgi:hypothetical protein